MTEIKKHERLPKKAESLNGSETIKNRPYERLLNQQFNRKYDDAFIENLADRMFIWFSETRKNTKGDDVPMNYWLKDFAIKEKIGSQRFVEFSQKNEYFQYVYEICKEMQESILFKLGLTAKTSMPIFALKAVAGWRDNEGEQNNGSKYSELAKLLGQTMVSLAGACRTESNNQAVLV